MPEIKKCPNCGDHMDLVSETLNLSHGKVHFRSWLCRSCGVRMETRRIGNAPEEALLVSQPRAVVDAALNDRMERETEGHRQFQAIGGRRNVRSIS